MNMYYKINKKEIKGNIYLYIYRYIYIFISVLESNNLTQITFKDKIFLDCVQFYTV